MESPSALPSASSSSGLDSFHGILGGGIQLPQAAGQLLQSITAGFFSRFPSPLIHSQHGRRSGGSSNSEAHGCLSCSSSSASMPVLFPFHCFSTHGQSASSSVSSALGSLSTSVRVDGLGPSAKGGGGGGPAFVGQVFSMCDPSGTGLMAVTTHFNIPFLSKRTPEWLKKMLATLTKSENRGPVFRFFMDLSDAVAYVKRLNIPTGMVGACRLDVAYGHFKEKPHMFQFVPNAKQVKAANKLLKANRWRSGARKLDGVPVFTAQNLNIAIATNDGIKWYTPYFFDKKLLDNILEASVDQHFNTMIQNRHGQRRGDVIDDNLTAEAVEENGESLFEPPEVQEVLDEMGHPRIPLSVISKVAEIQLLDVVDRVLLGNKWLRKATGIQPKFPYLVDSFEARSAASVLKATELTRSLANPEVAQTGDSERQLGAPELALNECAQGSQGHHKGQGFHLPFGDWFPNPWLKPLGEQPRPSNPIESTTRKCMGQVPANPLLPKITMVGISTGEAGKVSKASLKKTMEDLTRELEQDSQGMSQPNEDKDPLFVANVGDYSTITRMTST